MVDTIPAAARLGPAQRQDLSLQVLGRGEPVAHVAAEYEVSRKFIYEQAAKARDALDEAFAPSVPGGPGARGPTITCCLTCQ